MSVAIAARPGLDIRALADALAPGPIRIDPFGLVSGYKAYLIYTGLSAKPDEELARMGLSRTDLPRVAMSAVNVLKAG